MELASLLKNIVGDAVTMVDPRVYALAAKQLATHPIAFGQATIDSYGDLIHDPIGTFEEHPLLTALQVVPVGGAAVKGASIGERLMALRGGMTVPEQRAALGAELKDTLVGPNSAYDLVKNIGKKKRSPIEQSAYDELQAIQKMPDGMKGYFGPTHEPGYDPATALDQWMNEQRPAIKAGDVDWAPEHRNELEAIDDWQNMSVRDAEDYLFSAEDSPFMGEAPTGTLDQAGPDTFGLPDAPPIFGDQGYGEFLDGYSHPADIQDLVNNAIRPEDVSKSVPNAFWNGGPAADQAFDAAILPDMQVPNGMFPYHMLEGKLGDNVNADLQAKFAAMSDQAEAGISAKDKFLADNGLGEPLDWYEQLSHHVDESAFGEPAFDSTDMAYHYGAEDPASGIARMPGYVGGSEEDIFKRVLGGAAPDARAKLLQMLMEQMGRRTN